MKITKSDIVLSLVEEIQTREDYSRLQNVWDNYGVDLLEFDNESLERFSNGDVEDLVEFINQKNMAMAGQAADAVHKAATTVGGHIASGAQHVASAAAAHPAAAAGVGLGLAALAAIRARRNAKARAMAKA